MMVGADVTHPPQTRGLLQPSIAVTVAGIDADNVRFEPTIRLQEGRQEIIGDLENMIIGHIKAWEALNKAKPAKIIFFRDGVSEGQYMQVMALEVEAIRSAANKIGGGYKPKVTFVVCGKRVSGIHSPPDPSTTCASLRPRRATQTARATSSLARWWTARSRIRLRLTFTSRPMLVCREPHARRTILSSRMKTM